MHTHTHTNQNIKYFIRFPNQSNRQQNTQITIEEIFLFITSIIMNKIQTKNRFAPYRYENISIEIHPNTRHDTHIHSLTELDRILNLVTTAPVLVR